MSDREAILARLRGVFDAFDTKVEVSDTEVVASGDLAFARGTFRVTLRPRGGGESRQVERRYLEIWRKRDGSWRVARTMDNSG